MKAFLKLNGGSFLLGVVSAAIGDVYFYPNLEIGGVFGVCVVMVYLWLKLAFKR
jgi:hypothetical protein